jgi:hypothetical protein
LKQGGSGHTFPGFHSWPTPGQDERPPEITILSGRLVPGALADAPARLA